MASDLPARTADQILADLPPAERAALLRQFGSDPSEPFGDFAVRAAKLLDDTLPPDRANAAKRSIGATFAVLARQNKSIAAAMTNAAGRQSVALATVMVTLTGFSPGLPGMPGAKAYLIPRKTSVKEGGRWVKYDTVNWQVSAAGLRDMAAEDGFILSAVPLFAGDLVACPTIEDPSRLGWEAVPGGVPAEHGKAETPWAPVPLDAAAVAPPPVRMAQPDREWHNLAGFVVIARRRADGGLHGWRWVDRQTIVRRRNESDSYAQAVRDLTGGEQWEREKAEKSTWVKWAVEMAEKTAISFAIRRGMVPLADRMTQALSADDQGERVIDAASETVSRVTTRPRIPLPEPRQIAPTLDEPSEADRAAALAEEMAAAGGK